MEPKSFGVPANPLIHNRAIRQRMQSAEREVDMTKIGLDFTERDLLSAAGLCRQLAFENHAVGTRTAKSVAKAAVAELRLLEEAATAPSCGVVTEDGLSWPFDTWRRAIQSTAGTPHAFGKLFGIVLGQALEAGDMSVAKQVVDGIATLRSGATLVQPKSGQYFLAQRSSRSSEEKLETRAGLIRAIRIAAVDSAMRLVHSAVRLTDLVAEQVPRREQSDSLFGALQRLAERKHALIIAQNDVTRTDEPAALRSLTEAMKSYLDVEIELRRELAGAPDEMNAAMG